MTHIRSDVVFALLFESCCIMVIICLGVYIMVTKESRKYYNTPIIVYAILSLFIGILTFSQGEIIMVLELVNPQTFQAACNANETQLQEIINT